MRRREKLRNGRTRDRPSGTSSQHSGFYTHQAFFEVVRIYARQREVKERQDMGSTLWVPLPDVIVFILTKHFLKSLGSMPGRERLRRGRTWDRPSGYHFPAFIIGRATATIQFIQAISLWGSVKFSMAGYILYNIGVITLEWPHYGTRLLYSSYRQSICGAQSGFPWRGTSCIKKRAKHKYEQMTVNMKHLVCKWCKSWRFWRNYCQLL